MPVFPAISLILPAPNHGQKSITSFESLSHIIIAVTWVGTGNFLAWNIHPLFSLVAFIPFIHILASPITTWFNLALIALLLVTWNASVTFWLCSINYGKGLSVIIVNAAIMWFVVAIVLLLRHVFRIASTPWILFLFTWLLFEYLHFYWDLSWPWLAIGNVFGAAPSFIQWYEYTGVTGGTAWILVCNFVIWQIIFRRKTTTIRIALPVLAIPVLFSFVVAFMHHPKNSNIVRTGIIPTRTAAAHPLTDTARIRHLVTNICPHDSASIVLLPELFLANGIRFTSFGESATFRQLEWLKHKLKARYLLTGAQLYRQNNNGTHQTSGYASVNYDIYNAVVTIGHSPDSILLKTKKVYIPFEEYVPSYAAWVPIKSEHYARMRTPDRVMLDGNTYLLSICYESVNAFFISNHIGNAGAIFMFASESFFGQSDKFGKKQYANICRLRSIENRKPLVKCSNDGISFTCDSYGRIQLLNEHPGKLSSFDLSLQPGKTIFNFLSPILHYILSILFVLSLLYYKIRKTI